MEVTFGQASVGKIVVADFALMSHDRKSLPLESITNQSGSNEKVYIEHALL